MSVHNWKSDSSSSIRRAPSSLLIVIGILGFFLRVDLFDDQASTGGAAPDNTGSVCTVAVLRWGGWERWLRQADTVPSSPQLPCDLSLSLSIYPSIYLSIYLSIFFMLFFPHYSKLFMDASTCPLLQSLGLCSYLAKAAAVVFSICWSKRPRKSLMFPSFLTTGLATTVAGEGAGVGAGEGAAASCTSATLDDFGMGILSCLCIKILSVEYILFARKISSGWKKRDVCVCVGRVEGGSLRECVTKKRSLLTQRWDD